MTVQADTLYLPIPIPSRVRVDVESRMLSRHRPPPRQQWRPRVYRVADPRPIGETTYNTCGLKTAEAALGRLIDLYA